MHMPDELPIGTLISIIIFYLVIGIVSIAGTWRVFEKAGQPGWASLIPIYNIYVMTKIGGKPGYWTLLCCIPFLNFIFIIWLINMVSKSFGKDEGFTAGLIILGMIFWPVLGFGSALYQGPFGDPAAYAAFQNKYRFDFEQEQQQH